MAKLWDKGYELEEGIEQFTVGGDYILDQNLVEYDVYGNMAHASMLKEIGIISDAEFKKIKRELISILDEHEKGEFEIRVSDEDVHTAIENRLTQKLGDIGKKIHTGRSRNDQVILDLRLYMKQEILKIIEDTAFICQGLIKFAEENRDVPIPGRTHSQLAMPSSVGLWAGAFAEALLDDLKVLRAAYEQVDQCPLGSAASYGVALPIDRKKVSDLLGFAKVQNNVLYVNNSRGKVESVVLAALSQIMVDLSKMATDLIFFTIPEVGYFELPETFCTGSSMMPNKRNPDILELVRAKSEKVISAYNLTLNIIKDLLSGYNRDFQETKEPVMEGLCITDASLKVCTMIVEGLVVKKERCVGAFVPELFATDRAVELAAEGMPWRDAYLKVAGELSLLKSVDPIENIKRKKHVGATGNLGLDKSKKTCSEELSFVNSERSAFKKKIDKLIN